MPGHLDICAPRFFGIEATGQLRALHLGACAAAQLCSCAAVQLCSCAAVQLCICGAMNCLGICASGCLAASASVHLWLPVPLGTSMAMEQSTSLSRHPNQVWETPVFVISRQGLAYARCPTGVRKDRKLAILHTGVPRQGSRC